MPTHYIVSMPYAFRQYLYNNNYNNVQALQIDRMSRMYKIIDIGGKVTVYGESFLHAFVLWRSIAPGGSTHSRCLVLRHLTGAPIDDSRQPEQSRGRSAVCWQTFQSSSARWPLRRRCRTAALFVWHDVDVVAVAEAATLGRTGFVVGVAVALRQLVSVVGRELVGGPVSTLTL